MNRKKSSPSAIPTRVKGVIIAIDGPSGAGKSTVSRQLAEALEGRLLDTGAMYRTVAYFALKENAKTEEEFRQIASRIKFSSKGDSEILLMNGEDLGLRLRSEKVSQMASKVSSFKEVRQILTRKQRSLARAWSKKTPVVVEGRDIGTVVFPKVPFKFYVTADATVRAERRYQQLKRQGVKGITFKEILRQHEARDLRDSTRKLAPLKCAEEAVVVDTSSMGIPQVVKFMRDHIHAHVTLPNISRSRSK